VIVQTAGRAAPRPRTSRSIFVRGRNDTMIPLAAGEGARIVSPRELNHFNQRRSVSITANLAPDYTLGEALAFMDQTPAKVLKPGLHHRPERHLARVPQSQGALGVVFVLALLFIFLVLAAQFESFIDPLHHAARCRCR
jgi:multidrug efflux pump